MIIPFENENLLNIVILKNGFSTIGAVYSKLYMNKELNESDNTWNNIIKNIQLNDINYVGYKKFFVYRDPYERLVSMYKDILTGNMNHKTFLKLFKKRRYLCFNIDNFVNVCLNKISKDEHIKRQSDIIKESGYEPDFMVRMEDLSDFIEQELHIVYKKKHNQSKKNISVEGFEKYRERIKEVYKEDYDLYEKYKNKIWKKKKSEE